ncbi:ATP-binding protein [Staphylococcus lentus]|uniref:ATP-binding protein n=1 Tax=Mammaliicoccus lentus TaxID=42858 RepID=UPI00188478B8|nr:ATP-binding protein [Mammaliicoccus lentus]MBF0841004.1 ATP-binding protein [Mammaliicoccus lentus]
MEDILLTPYAPNLVESTRSIGYSFETAIADIIDNSISNKADRVDVKFQIENRPFVAIIDNGIGMSKEELEHAMRYGSSNSLETRNKDDLGRFGLGMKMASLSQCRKLTVLTKQKDVYSGTCWDLDYIYSTKSWSLISYNEEEIKQSYFYKELDKYESGTIVIWENLDKISESELDFENELNQKIDMASKHLGLVFHRFLDKKSNNIYFELFFNNRKIDYIDPFMLNNNATQPLEEEVIFIEKNSIKIKPYIIPYMSKLSAREKQVQNQYRDLNLNQGLYIYRNKRLIVWGKWFYLLRESELNRLARIRVDLPNYIDDYWKIDVRKSSAQIPSFIKPQLKQIIERAVGKSERVYKYRGRNLKKDNFQHIWNKIVNRDKIQYLINKDIPLYKALENSLDDNQLKLLNGFVNSIEDAFPYASVYYDLARDEQYEENTLEYNEVYEMAKNTLNSTDDKEGILKVFKQIDMFQKYPEVIKMLEEEIKFE